MVDDKIVVHRVELGFDVGEEVSKVFKAEISPDTIKDSEEVLQALSQKSSNKKTMDKIESDKKLEMVVLEIKEKLIITKERMFEIMGEDNLISIVGRLKSYVKKYHNKNLIKQKDGYSLAD